ncbi:hypothetical protein ABT095_26510 [Kitasatospora sp. NPDC002227]|uniref:hypothetical protein n=1 Tax=Kitasatospora sp. NPDC002227 TaxID=3154773 RepID=UPI00331F2057
MGPAETEQQTALTTLGELACRYRTDEIPAAELPMLAAELLAAGLDTPTLCDLAGWPRTAYTDDIRAAFEQSLAEAGIPLPEPGLAWRHALRRQAARYAAGELTSAGPVNEDSPWEAVTEAERAFLDLIPQCGCCIEYTVPVDRQSWEAQLHAAALALLAAVPAVPGC